MTLSVYINYLRGRGTTYFTGRNIEKGMYYFPLRDY